ncbi:MAG TPA: 3-hydroxyacyl-CoA dehydrogenase NAD-binding domain-containing protein [Gemmataceae bacterium]|jgi:3-hydroxyacyl-CoA dehydrogenase|nr:3-hydroxyacyl-CoA dehydrogenase NAD-binding domain-containing protein [Gemmataceae bacterium]
MSDLVTVTRDGDVGVVTIDNPPVNALSPGVLDGLIAALKTLRADDAIKSIVLNGSGKIFCGGADINEFGKLTSGKKSLDVGFATLLSELEDNPKPVVCAIHGTAFGGGLETAMACHYRVATPDAQVGQPEVKIGLIPGAGGTQRLPRLAGVAKAAEMCAGGEPVKAPDALAAGILDKLIDGDLLKKAVAYAREVAAKGPPRKTRDLKEKLGSLAANAVILAAVREQVKKKARGLTAPFKAVDAIEASLTLPFAEGVKREAELFRECLFSDQSKALIHVFFAEREVPKVPGIAKDTPRIPIRRAAVVGAGTMGGGIAMTYANAGIPVLLKEVDQPALDRGLATIKKNYASTVSKGRLTQQQMDERLARIEPTLSYDRFAEADIVVEAVFEGMGLKKKVFAEIDKVARPDAILASNTSTLNIDEIASATGRPRKVIGHHFFSPANVMKLLEIVRGKQSAPEVIATSLDLAKRLGKVGVLVGNCPAFVGNRMFDPYIREAQFLVEEGAKIEEVDAALTSFGMAMGPLAVLDLAGLDVGWRIRKEGGFASPPGRQAYRAEDRLCELGHFGQKTGAGWYKYEGGMRTTSNPDAARFLAEAGREAGITPRTITAEEIVERTVYALINEGARILEEGIALRAGDIDIVYIYGYGFPAWRGGPMCYADTVGLKAAHARIRDFEKQHGARWAPAPLLTKLADSGKTFASLDAARA